ncbi:hypothetical protein CORC01_08289 [Colletotrichum orchidophilum]|uniref:Uncharacterized protein n=1 Tax=Colletotrichum orchidophilum TaxID=1209926 RepID=A0A1G4B4U5_9PEZI|nr:uncharacterized protein CORC01_08289 [Colletotrichum orchidophilum]OHE96366.1 hypothetical protein CORC01_08289 [Colletotrichum orchidophilum]
MQDSPRLRPKIQSSVLLPLQPPPHGSLGPVVSRKRRRGKTEKMEDAPEWKDNSPAFCTSGRGLNLRRHMDIGDMQARVAMSGTAKMATQLSLARSLPHRQRKADWTLCVAILAEGGGERSLGGSAAVRVDHTECGGSGLVLAS